MKNKQKNNYVKCKFSAILKGMVAVSLLMLLMSACTAHKHMGSSKDVVIYSNDSVTTKAEFPGGTREFNKYVRLYLQSFKRSDTQNLGEGRGIYSFVVDQEGNIKDVKVIQKISPQKDIAMIDLMEKMPKWNPATLNGNPVCVRVDFFWNYCKAGSTYDIGPYFPGGTEALNNYLTGYSEGDKEGNVAVDIIIDEEGNVEIESIRSSRSYHMSRETESIIKGMPKWIPAQKNGKPVRAKKRVYVYFPGN